MHQAAKKNPVQLFSDCPAPDPGLAGLVRYWSMDSGGKAVPLVMRIPGEHIEVIFDYECRGRKKGIYLLGAQLKSVLIGKKKPIDVIGVRFLRGSFYSLFRIPAYRFFGKKLPLESAIGKKAACFDEVFTKETLEARVKCLDSILLNMAKTRDPVPSAIIQSFEAIYASKGKIKVSSLARNAGLTRFKLTNTFKKWVGISPRLCCKHFCFRKAMRELSAGSKTADVIAKSGYFDQAHFIRNFKRRMGLTPMQHAKRGRQIRFD